MEVRYFVVNSLRRLLWAAFPFLALEFWALIPAGKSSNAVRAISDSVISDTVDRRLALVVMKRFSACDAFLKTSMFVPVRFIVIQF